MKSTMPGSHRSWVGCLALLASFVAAGCSSDEATSATLASLSQGCNINSECASPLVCAFRRCHVACQETRDCKSVDPKARCVEADKPLHVCQLDAESKCVHNSDCSGTAVCARDGQCRDACAADRDCLNAQKCVSGSCAETAELVDGGLPGELDAGSETTGQTCAYDSDCAAPLVCRDGACSYACLADVDCAAGQRCDDHRCVVPACGMADRAVPSGVACQYSSECVGVAAIPLVCRGGFCMCECLGDVDCADGFACLDHACKSP